MLAMHSERDLLRHLRAFEVHVASPPVRYPSGSGERTLISLAATITSHAWCIQHSRQGTGTLPTGCGSLHSLVSVTTKRMSNDTLRPALEISAPCKLWRLRLTRPGISFSGGNVMHTAAVDKRNRAVIIRCPAVSRKTRPEAFKHRILELMEDRNRIFPIWGL